jgi:thiamine monophosphate synthase
MKKGAPPCGLYLRIGPDPAMDKIMPALRQAAFVVNRSEYERNMHVIEVATGEGEAANKAVALVQLAKMEGLTALMKASADEAAAAGADGVMLEHIEKVEEAREKLGKDAIIALACGISRAIAEQAKEQGVDCVQFGAPEASMLPSTDLFSWWSTLTAIPSIAAGPVTNDNAGAYVRAGASFLDASPYVWDNPKGVMQGTVNMLYAIDLAAEELVRQ